MAPPTVLTHGSAAGGASVYNTASVAPGTGLLLVVTISGFPAEQPTITGLGLDWTHVRSGLAFFDTQRVSLFTAKPEAVPTPGEITLTLPGNSTDGVVWQVLEAEGADSVVQSASAQGSSAEPIVANLGAFSAVGNAAFGILQGREMTAATEGDGYTLLQTTTRNLLGLATEWKGANDQSVEWAGQTGMLVGYPDIWTAIAAELNYPPPPVSGELDATLPVLEAAIGPGDIGITGGGLALTLPALTATLGVPIPPSTFLSEIAQYLALAGLGTYAPTGDGGTIFIEKMPQSPNAAIALFATGGLQASGMHGYDLPVVNIQVRGAPNNPLAALAKAEAIYGALQGLHAMALPGGTRVINCRASQSYPISLGRDGTERQGYSLNFEWEVRNVTANRE